MSEISSVVLFVGSIIAIAVVSAADDPQITYLGSGCSENISMTYRNVTTFNNNQAAVYETLASNLSSNINGSHFATSVIENGTTDPVFGLAQCREYLTTNECLECFNAEKAKVKQVCPRSNGAKLHLDGCFLRFEDNSFFNEGTDGGDTQKCSSATMSDDFSSTAQKLLIEVIANASKTGGYAVGSLDSLYALGQCVKTLDNDTCQECLSEARGRLTVNCILDREAHALMAGCFMRYANYPFFSHNLTGTPQLLFHSLICSGLV